MPYQGLTDQWIEEYTRIASDTAETIIKKQTRENVFDPKMIQTLQIVETQIRKRKLVVYGGTAINAILPKPMQFYDSEFDLPDWDFFSDNPIKDAIEIADKILSKTGNTASVSTAAHFGTYKVFSDGIAVADITSVSPELLNVLRKHAKVRNGIHYSGPNYLRMSAYLELSRPMGQPDRWEKVIKRLSLLNRAYPIKIPMTETIVNTPKTQEARQSLLTELVKIQETTKFQKDNNGSVFAFVGPEIMSVARSLLQNKKAELNAPGGPLGLMIVTPNLDKTTEMILEILTKQGFSPNVQSVQTLGEFVGNQNVIYYQKVASNRVIVTIIETQEACQSILNVKVRVQGKRIQNVQIGSLETILYMYLALLFSKSPIGHKTLLKSVDSLIKLHIQVLQKQKVPLLPLPISCIGKQKTISDMRKEKVQELKEIIPKYGRGSYQYILRNIRYEAGDSYMRKLILLELERMKHPNSKKFKDDEDETINIDDFSTIPIDTTE